MAFDPAILPLYTVSQTVYQKPMVSPLTSALLLLLLLTAACAAVPHREAFAAWSSCGGAACERPPLFRPEHERRRPRRAAPPVRAGGMRVLRRPQPDDGGGGGDDGGGVKGDTIGVCEAGLENTEYSIPDDLFGPGAGGGGALFVRCVRLAKPLPNRGRFIVALDGATVTPEVLARFGSDDAEADVMKYFDGKRMVDFPYDAPGLLYRAVFEGAEGGAVSTCPPVRIEFYDYMSNSG